MALRDGVPEHKLVPRRSAEVVHEHAAAGVDRQGTGVSPRADGLRGEALDGWVCSGTEEPRARKVLPRLGFHEIYVLTRMRYLHTPETCISAY